MLRNIEKNHLATSHRASGRLATSQRASGHVTSMRSPWVKALFEIASPEIYLYHFDHQIYYKMLFICQNTPFKFTVGKVARNWNLWSVQMQPSP